nr:DUF885 domain-containing protein [uncultured Roseateles sp.]
MATRRQTLLTLSSALALPLQAMAQTAAASLAPAFDDWAEHLALERMRADPVLATSRQYLPPAEQELLDGQLTPNTKAYRAARVAAARAALQQMRSFDRSRLGAQQRTSAAVIEWSLQNQVDGEAFSDYQFVFHQFRGLHISLVNFLSQSHPVRNARDIANYLSRLEQVAGQIDRGIAQAADAATRGFLMPRFITEASLGQLQRFLGDAAAKNVLVTSLDERAAQLAGIPAEARAAAVAQAEKITADAIIPAYRRVQALLQAQLPQTTDDAGLWRLPGGDKAYAFELRRQTTTDYTPAEIHALGLSEVARIEAEMDGLLRQLGYAEGSVKQRIDKLELDQQPKEADPRPALLARYEAIVRDAERRARTVFEITPKAPVVVKREPPFTEKTAAAHYAGPARDGTRPGIFWVPLPGAPFRMAGMRTLAYHEAVPGHHFQISLQQESTQLPRYRRDAVFSGGPAYSEGWGLYAEQLAAENGWYEGDTLGRLGQLDAELFRARRLVADTGLHAMKWTRQQTIAYGLPLAEVDRYVVMPGQACAYKLGMLSILDARAKAQQALGAKFAIKAFHSLVLGTGNVPLAVLAQVVDDWVAAQR